MSDKNILSEKQLTELLDREAGKIDPRLDLWPLIEKQLKAAQTSTEFAVDPEQALLDPSTVPAGPRPIFTLPRVTRWALGIAAVLALAFIVGVALLPGKGDSEIPSIPASIVAANPTVPPPTPAPHVVTATLQATLTGHTEAVRELAWNPDGMLLASASEDQTVKVWAPSGLVQSSSIQNAGPVPPLPWPRDVTRTTLFGKTTELLAPDGKLKLVQVSNTAFNLQQLDGKFIASVAIQAGFIGQLAWSPDSKIIAGSGQSASPGGPGDIRVWLWKADGTLIATLEDFYYPVNSMAWSADSQSIAIAAKGENQAGIWSAEGKPLVRFEGNYVIWQLAWSPDGQTLAAACSDNMVRLFGKTGKLEATLAGHQDTVWAVAWSPDGKTLASGSGDKTIKLWTIK